MVQVNVNSVLMVVCEVFMEFEPSEVNGLARGDFFYTFWTLGNLDHRL
jgi:hypothetical protein